MPAIAAFFARQLVIIGVQLGIFAAIDRYVVPLLNSAIQAIVVKFGVAESEAQDILANSVITTAESLGLTVALSKARLPLLIADKLRFTTKGFAKRPLTPSTQAKVSTAATQAVPNVVLTSTQATEVASTIAATRGISGSQVKSVFDIIFKVAGLGFLGTMVVSNVIDFGNWNGGAYQHTMQKVIEALSFGTLTPDTKLPSSNTVSQDTWDRLLAIYKTNGAVGINDPYKAQSVLFSRQALTDIVDKRAAAAQVGGQSATIKTVLAWVTPMIVFNAAAATQTTSTGTGASTTASSGAGGTPVQIKIYTGVVSQGTLGLPQEFIARPDDMIQNVDELKAAAKNNLASFITALPGKFYYEIGVQSTYRTKAGTTIKGDAVKVVSGYYSNGNPRYKTVYYKFGVLKLGVIDENGRNVKLGTVLLGPINVVDFQPTQAQLVDVQNSITPELFTNDISDITTVVAPNGIGVSTSTPVNPNPPQAPLASAQITPETTTPPGKAIFKASNVSFFIPAGGSIFIPTRPQGIAPQVFARSGDTVRMLNLQSLVETKPCGAYGGYSCIVETGAQVNNISQIWDAGIAKFEARTGLKYYDLPQQNIADVEAVFMRGAPSTLPDQMRAFEGSNALNDFVAFLGALLPGGDIDITGGGLTLNDAARSATTLASFFAALGKPLPSLAERAITYEQLGLGPRGTYGGTTEQNNRLLAILKGQ